MLNLIVKKLLLTSIPSSLIIDGHSFTITKTLGSVPLNKVTLPTVNIKFIGEGTPYYRSMDDSCVSVDTTSSYENICSCVIRYTVGAIDSVINATDNIKFITGTNVYDLQRVPSINIVSVDSHLSTDYRLSTNHDAIEWINNKPTNNSTFHVNYNWVNSGFYISQQLIDYMMQDVRGRVFNLISQYDVNIIDYKGVTDISEIYTSDAFNVFTFDVIVTYPFTWSTTIATEDASIADSISMDLIVNDHNIETISYTK